MKFLKRPGWLFNMDIIENYKLYRKTGKELNNKIMNTCLEREILMKSADLLGLAHNNTLLFDSVDETSVLMDFAFFEYKVKNKNVVEIYREKIGGKNEIEREILDAACFSYTSLFEIVSVSSITGTLLLKDLNEKEDIKLTDIGFSKSSIPGLILFIRLIACKDFNMTSGISFVFNNDLKENLIKKHKKLSEKLKPDKISMKRFITFYKLNKTSGIKVRYE